jgi:23S rRNA (cytosine1962-C5)-methyltransferase
MILREFNGVFILDKPAGTSTHTPDGGATDGFIEMAGRILGRQLWAVHRLDNTTSGCLLVTSSSQNVDIWTQILSKGKKKYVFISPEKSKEAVWSFSGRIEKTGNHQFALVDGEPNSQTTFARLGPCGLGILYEAEISTGKTHQIRIHAQASEIPILGDSEYGGAPFFRVMLHSKELELDGEKTISPLPKVFNLEKDETHFEDLAKFLISLDRRRFLMDYNKDQTDAFRLVHREWATKKGVRLAVEKLGNVLQILSYYGRDPDRDFLKTLSAEAGCDHWFVRQMFNRGTAAGDTIENIKSSSPELPLQWEIKESRMKFDLRYNQGLSSGLFLDQRLNRDRVLKSAQGKRVANFFAYTCGFSVAAALGGAHEVVSVDTSATSLDWGKDNFKLNGLDPQQFEFFKADALFFLRSCLKRERVFDIIILDPPTFSRSKIGTFKIKENLQELLELSFKCLDRRGNILITVNDEDMTPELLSRAIEEAALKTQFSPLRIERAQIPYDFEFPLERNTVMKGYWISKL